MVAVRFPGLRGSAPRVCVFLSKGGGDFLWDRGWQPCRSPRVPPSFDLAGYRATAYKRSGSGILVFLVGPNNPATRSLAANGPFKVYLKIGPY